MITLPLAVVLYMRYKQKHDRVEFKDYPLDDDVLRFFETRDEKSGIQVPKNDKKISFANFLPAEIQTSHYSSSLTTITFYEGDYRKIENKLKRRVNDVLATNPWLGGRMVVKPGDDKLRLWFDSNGVDIPPDIYTCYEPGVIPLKHSAKYEHYEDILADHDVVVPCIEGLVGKNIPCWRVNVVPDAAQHERFAIIVSQSHMIGDAHTYYKIFHMLFNSNSAKTKGLVNTGPVEKLNPSRKQDVQQHIENHMGVRDAAYMRKTNSNMIDDVYETVASTIHSKKRRTLCFTVSETWLKSKMDECITAKTKEDESECSDGSCDNVGTSRHGNVPLDISYQEESLSSATMESTDASRKNAQEDLDLTTGGSPEITLRKAVTSVTVESSIDDCDHAEHIHVADILLSWWFRISKANIGLYPNHLRDVLTAVLSEGDAGNYNTPIPFTKRDFQNPQQIHDSITSGKRVQSNGRQRPLPRITTGFSFAVGMDWDKVYSGRLRYHDADNSEQPSDDGSDNDNGNGNEDDDDDDDDDGIVQDLHVPFFREIDLKSMPARTDTCLIFTAKHGQHSNERQIGMLLVTSEAICKRVAQSGIIDEDIATNDIRCNDDHRSSSIADLNPKTSDTDSMSEESMVGDESGILAADENCDSLSIGSATTGVIEEADTKLRRIVNFSRRRYR
eukprot:jgi/Psemu1/245928/estExt_Genewise1.C_6650012